ncbi:GntR family transcriptional regulator [Escherichia coli]|nr:GntR family transcriptional regulator [Escherichia coli]
MRIVSKLTFWGMIFLFSVNAYAGQLDSSGLLDTLLDRFQQVASTWSLVIGDYANWLFWGLVLISMAWTFGMLAMQGEGLISALAGNDSNLLIVFYVQIMPDDFVMQLHRF